METKSQREQHKSALIILCLWELNLFAQIIRNLNVAFLGLKKDLI